MAITPVILCGGAGTRLWPLSREKYPKQLLNLNGTQSLLKATLCRLENLDFAQNPPIVIANEAYCYQVAEELRQMNIHNARIVLEPIGKNTAPALTLAALVENNPESLLLVMPSDHVIANKAAFQQAVLKGIGQAQQNKVITFGIVPQSAHTGYGYILKGKNLSSGVFELKQFVEKPQEIKAQEYVQSGNYFWNSGIFLLNSALWLKEIQKQNPRILECAQNALKNGKQNSEFIRLNQADFEQSPSDSIDYAVAEHLPSDQASVVELSAEWSDLGAFDALYALSPKDENGNALSGDIFLEKTQNSYIRAESKLVACLGLNNMVVVETNDALLVADFKELQNIKNVVAFLKAHNRIEAYERKRVVRPWGSYEQIDCGNHFQVKKIVVNPGAALSLQMHYHRAEHWIIVIGTAKVTKGDEEILLSENQSIYIPLGVKHRLENPGSIPLELIEVQSGAYLGEDDIVRFEDIYGRN